MLKFLPGSKNHNRVQDSAIFFGALSRHLRGAKIGVFDVETGPLPLLGRKYAVPIGYEALTPLSAEILLAGWMMSSLREFSLVNGDGQEKQIVTYLISQIETLHQAGGTLVGHNILAFDIPMLVERAKAHQVPFPEWLALASASGFNAGPKSVVDTYSLFNDRSLFANGGISLFDLSRLWGRSLESFGSVFGEMWRAGHPSDRDALKLYNLWDLLDTLSLAAFSGLADHLRETPSTVALDSPTLPVLPWVNDGVYQVEPDPVITGEPLKANASYFSWITAPVTGLWSQGPSSSSAWGIITTEEAMRAYPLHSGRQDPRAVQIVGSICCSGAENRLFFHPDDEVLAINSSLAWLDTQRKSSSTVWTSDPTAARALVTIRSSCHNGIVPTWLNFEKSAFSDLRHLLPRDTNLAGYAEARKFFKTKLFDSPSYCGQSQDTLMASVKVWSSVVSDLLYHLA